MWWHRAHAGWKDSKPFLCTYRNTGKKSNKQWVQSLSTVHARLGMHRSTFGVADIHTWGYVHPCRDMCIPRCVPRCPHTHVPLSHRMSHRVTTHLLPGSGRASCHGNVSPVER